MPSSRMLLRLAEQADRDAAKLEVEAAKAREQARELRRLAGIAESEVDTGDTDSTVVSMDVNTDSESVRRAAGRATRKHPAQKRLYQKGVTITELAKELGEGRPRVSAWFATGVGNRAIPKRYADRLKEKYGIPLTNWKRIAD